MNPLGVIGVFTALLVISGGATYLLLDKGEVNYAYVCPSTNVTGLFPGGLSPTGLTAYIVAGNSTGSKRCSVPWETCASFAAKHNVSCVDALPVSSCVNVSLPSGFNEVARVNDVSGWTVAQYTDNKYQILLLSNYTCIN